MEPASSRALGIAHVVANILRRQIDTCQQVDRRNVSWLPKLALVNKLWADEVTEMIWAHLEDLEPLQRVKPDRRQYYAAKIRSLRVELDPRSPPVTACLLDLALSRLREVEMMFYWDATLQHIPPILTPELRKVTVHCSNRCLSRATDYAMQAIMMRCKSLETLKFIVPSRHLDSDRLLELLISQGQTLLDFRIHLADVLAQPLLNEEISTYIAGQSVMRNVHVPQLKLYAPRDFTSFGTLEMLDAKVDYQALFTISASLPRLKTLRATLLRCQGLSSEPLDPILSRLAASAQLEILELNRGPQRRDDADIQTPVTLSGAVFADFTQSCRGLREFCLAIQPGIAVQDFDVEHLRCAALSLPRLREVRLYFTPEASSLAAAAVSVFGENCPELESCHILGEFTVLDIDWDTETIFPKLRSLSLNQIRGQKTNSSLDTYDSNLRKKFPRLELLQVMKAFPGALSAPTCYFFNIPRAPRSDPSA